MLYKRSALRASIVVPLFCILALSIAALVLPTSPIPQLAIVTPIVYAFAILADSATVAILVLAWTNEPPDRSSVIVALAFAATAIFTFLAMLTLPLIQNVPAVITGHGHPAMWLFVSWHAVAACGGLLYVGYRSRRAVTASRRFIIVAASIAGTGVAVLATGAFALGDRLPVLASEASVSGLITSGVGPTVATLLVLAGFLALRIRQPAKLDRAFAFALLALALELIMLLVGGRRYSASYYAGRLLLLASASFVFFSALELHVGSRVRLREIERKLSRMETQSNALAGRIHALRQITAHSAQTQNERFSAILAMATTSIRPGKPMLGFLSHVEDGLITVDAVSWSGESSFARSYTDEMCSGANFPFERTMQSVLSAEGITQGWDDLSVHRGRDLLFEELGLQSAIGAPIAIGRKTHFIVFCSPETNLDQPFTNDDIAYVDVVAAFFATRFAEELQYERIQFQVEHDALTGLKNRAQFRNAVRKAIGLGEAFAVAFVDIDAFRHINERHGNQLGDEILVEVGAGLRDIREIDFVARTSADEFGIVLYGVDSVRGIEDALDRYARRFREPFHTGDRDGTIMLSIGASIGAASFPADGSSPEELMKRADIALAQAKARGGSATTLFEPSMESILQEKHVRLAELAHAIATDELTLEFQPTFDLATREIVGAEALVRWNHPEMGRIGPDQFVPFAERNGMLTDLTRWVFRRLTREVSSHALPPGFRVYFNIGAQTLDDFAFISELNETLCATPGLVRQIGVEVTETAAMQNIESAMHTINLFRGWGLSVAIDDFGTGYSSLSYLKELTVDMIKIDRSFVTGLTGHERGSAITEMLLKMSEHFGFAPLAEGIETESEASWLLEHGCRLGQGFLVAKPSTFESLLSLLRRSSGHAIA